MDSIWCKAETDSQIQPRRTTRKQPRKVEKAKRDFYMRWSEDEKNMLLVALETYGPRELDKIAEVVGTRSRDEVMCALKYWKKQSAQTSITATFRINKKDFEKKAVKGRGTSTRNYKSVAGIELWIEVMLKHLCQAGGSETNVCVPSSVKLIACFEALPSVEEADGVDFRQLYLWLAELMTGQPIRSLSVASSTFLAQCTRDLCKHAANNQWPRIGAAVARIVDNVWCPNNIKSYSKRSDQPQKKKIHDRVRSVLDTPGLNTVGLDMDRLISQQTL